MKNPFNRNKKVLLIMFVLFCIFAGSLHGREKSEDSQEITSLEYGLRVDSIDRVADLLTGFANKNNGYLFSLGSGYAEYRIPVIVGREKIELLIQSIPGAIIYRSSRQSEDVTVKLVDLKAKLKVAEENLKRLQALSRTAGLDDLLDLEKALHNTLQEVENKKGEIRFLEESAKMFAVKINMNQSGVTSDPELIPVPWIRNLTLQSGGSR